ncbi:MAG TPA: histidine phosphatase family protein [Candidatus Paceibacterota bacterium]
MRRVYFVRHGESEANVARIHGGEHHALTEEGRRQARVIAQRCLRLKLDALFASPLVRAQQTAVAIAEATQLPIQTSDLFSELRGPSMYMEKPVDDPEIIKGYFEMNKSWAPGYRHLDEENFDEILARAGRALEFLAERPEDTVAVVSHALFLRALAARALFGPEVTPHECLRFFYSVKQSNTGLTAFEYRPMDALGNESKFPWQLITWNDHAHLG